MKGETGGAEGERRRGEAGSLGLDPDSLPCSDMLARDCFPQEVVEGAAPRITVTTSVSPAPRPTLASIYKTLPWPSCAGVCFFCVCVCGCARV